MNIIEYDFDSHVERRDIEAWNEQTEKTYRIQLLIVEDDSGNYSAIAMNLPGAGSCGDTKEEAVSNAREAIQGVLESYKDANESIPWREVTAEMIGDGEIKVIFV